MSSPDAAQSAPARFDAFYGGLFHLYQPAGWGFRAGLDALLLAACVPLEAAGLVADIGAGTGAVAFAAAARAPGLSFVLVENAPEMADLMDASIGEAANAALAHRLRLVRADILSGRAARTAAGLGDGAFDLVLTNPPFCPAGYRASADPARRAALVAPGPDFLTRWLRACAALLKRGGRMVVVLRPADLPAAAQALEARAGGLTVLPVHTRPGPARRILVAATAGSRAGLSILPSLDLTPSGDPDGTLSRAIATGVHTVELV